MERCRNGSSAGCRSGSRTERRSSAGSPMRSRRMPRRSGSSRSDVEDPKTMSTKFCEVDYLFGAAHADDIELSCSATLAKAAKEGRRCGMLELTRGELGTRGTPQQRKREAQASAKILR